MILIEMFLTVLAVYFGIGVLFGIYFIIKGAVKIDPQLEDSKWSVRLLLLPGTIAMWPFLTSKLLKSKQ